MSEVDRNRLEYIRAKASDPNTSEDELIRILASIVFDACKALHNANQEEQNLV